MLSHAKRTTLCVRWDNHETPPVRRVPSMSHARILVVEDSPTQRLFAQMLLEAAGFTVVTAPSAEDVDADALRDVDLALVDHVLPGASGLELCRRIVDTGGPAVVSMTGPGTVDALPAYLAAGAVSWIAKPLDATTLATRVRSILAAEAGRDAAEPVGPTRAHLVDLVEACALALARLAEPGEDAAS